MIKAHNEFAHVLDTSEKIRNYIFGGQGIVTLLSPSGISHTYVIKHPNERDQFPDDVYFVYALHENEKLFYIGMIENEVFRLTRSSRFLYDSDIVKGARYIMKMAHDDKYLSKMRLIHCGVCSRCGRPLTSVKSRITGIGPKCSKKLKCR